MVDILSRSERIAVDTETTSKDPMRAELVGISLAVDPKTGYYIPVGHVGGGKQLSLHEIQTALEPIFKEEGKQIVGQNLKYDWLVLTQHGFGLPHLYFDTMIAEWLINPSSHNLGLKDMAEVYLHKRMTHIEELIGTGKNQKSMADVSVEQAAPYAAADAAITLALVPALAERLEKQNASQLFHTLEMPLIPILGEMERNGIALDIPFLIPCQANLPIACSR